MLISLSPSKGALVAVLALTACSHDDSGGAAPSSSASVAASVAALAPPPPPLPWRAAAIAHGGVGSPPKNADGCRRAVDAALKVLEAGGDPMDAAAAGVVVLEDDARFNAGTGSKVRIDGETVQMDASVMRSDGVFGAVAGIEQVKNPVLVAREVTRTPHLLIAGDGATRFARTLGMPVYDPTTPETRAQAKELQKRLVRGDVEGPWRTFDWRARWNFARTPREAGLDAIDGGAVAGVGAGAVDAGHDTVGVAVRATDGRFAVALSTGGTSITLRGRVGDVPILGAGLYAGPDGAAAATGTGERIVEAGLARKVHERLAAGASAEEAAKRAVVDIGGKGDIGIVVIGVRGMGAAADRPMAWAGREAGSDRWQGP